MSSMTTRTGGHGMPPKLKTITYVERLTFDFSGNIAQNAVCLADVDNDGEVELSVGNSDGDLVIFKGTNPRPWRSSSVKLGHITAMCSGDLFNMGQDVLVVISADGFLHLFDSKSMEGELKTTPSSMGSNPVNTTNESFPEDVCTPTSSSASTSVPSTPCNQNLSTSSSSQQGDGLSQSASPEKDDESERGNLVIKPAYRQRIPANIKAAMIVDTNGDGFKELVVTLTDRVVRTYQWHHTGDIMSMQAYKGHLMSRHKWEFASQVGSTSISRDDKDRPLLIISQPGGAFIQIRVPPRRSQVIDAFDDDEEVDKDDSPLKVVRTFEPLVVSNLRNSYVSTEILGDFKTCADKGENHDDEKKASPPFAIATLDGDLIFAQKDNLLWNIHLNQQLFCLHKMDIDEDGKDELIVSSWDGHTYIVSQDCRGTEFVFGESVLAFSCGKYTVEDETVKVFVYVTANGKIFVYHDIALPKDNDMSAFPEDLILGNELHVTSKVSKFLLYYPFKRTEASKIES